MMSRYALALTACLVPLLLPAVVVAAPSASKGLECAAMIQLTTANWPADHPSTTQAKTLKSDLLSFAKTLSFPETMNVDIALAAQISTIESTMIGMMGDPAGTQAYMVELSQGCDAIPFTPLAPAICKAYASAEKKSAETMTSMLAYNSRFDDTLEKRARTAHETQKAADELKQAEAAFAHFESAGEMSQEEAMDVISTLDPDARKARYATCLKQMG